MLWLFILSNLKTLKDLSSNLVVKYDWIFNEVKVIKVVRKFQKYNMGIIP